MRRKLVLGLVMVAALGATVTAYFTLRGGPADPQITAVAITRGSILKTVQATGTLQAVSTVEVGSQVSGRISELHADFNSIVHKGEIIARLDPSLFQAQVDQARATLARIEAQENGAVVQQKDAQNKLTRAKDLAKSNLIATQDLEAAQTTYDAAVAAVASARADAVQARAQLNQAQLNLQHTIIQAPTDGVVISRSVEVGQTVAAAMQAPTLFTIAGDLSLMQVNASIDEADIGSIRPKQPVDLHGGRVCGPHVQRPCESGTSAAHGRPERDDLHHRDRRAEQGSAVEAGHDGHRDREGGGTRGRAQSAERGASLPSDT